ncbi:MAG: DUF296 domain-containing protein [Xanthobacteraceae bacterium]
MRYVRQPGAPLAERIQWAPVSGRSFTFRVEAGLPLLEAVRRGFASAGFKSGVLRATAGALEPFAYVMPALSKTGEHAAFYSDTFRPAGTTFLTAMAMTLGLRDDAAFFHCHALWHQADGTMLGGHILPEETYVAEPFDVQAFGIEGAKFVAEHDTETNFRLFGPKFSAAGPASSAARAFALRLRPNQDLTTALEQFCRSQGFASAIVHGGVGSIIGARFTDGRRVDPFVTEMAIRSGEIAPDPNGAPRAKLDVVLVDHTGGTAEGVLLRGDNPVLMTMELVLEPLSIRL